ncbi:MAG: hypothetical protein ABSD62_01615 [Candidatus Limnocylindrales bacterium]|jgi:hypothetical protein
MTVTTSTGRTTLPWSRLARPDLTFVVAVLVAYVTATAAAVVFDHASPDRMMLIAERALGGHLDYDGLRNSVDTVNVNGHYYLAVGPLQLLPYLPFAAVPALQGIGRYIVGLAFGVPAAWLSLPLARAYGAKAADAYWIAIFTAFGSLLWYISVFGDMYFLAHAESFLALTILLLEWSGRRRPIVLGAALAVSFLARPTTVLAAVPFGLALLWQSRMALTAAARSAIAFGLPVAAAIGVYGWYNWVRFGSPLESGYAISLLRESTLESRRAVGVFSIAHVPENLRLALLAPLERIGKFPYIGPSKFGMSMLLVSPALLTSIRAGFRDGTARLLWLAAALVAVPVFLYYGGGYVQYGFRYSLDFTPFLVALMAMGSQRWIGRPERILILAGVASVLIGVIIGIDWHS